MVVLNRGKATEVTLRLVLESAAHGSEYFDGYETINEIIGAMRRLLKSASEGSAKDRVERSVAIAIIPKTQQVD